MPLPKDDGDESILQEAQRLTHGSRNADYGHPLDDYTRTANLINSLFAHKLCEPLTPEDAASIQILVKLSRHQNAPKRDNMVDAAGYAWVAWACTEERARRKAQEVGDLYQLTPDPLQPQERITGMHPALGAPFGSYQLNSGPPAQPEELMHPTLGVGAGYNNAGEAVEAPKLTPGRLTLNCGCKGYCKCRGERPIVRATLDESFVVPEGTGALRPLSAFCAHGYTLCSVCDHPAD